MIDPITSAGGSTTASSTSSAAAATAGSVLGKDDFLQLLVSQLRNQDPMNPADPKEMAAQLAQFSAVEQLINIGDELKAQSAGNDSLIQSINASTAAQLLGKSVLIQGDALQMPASGPLDVKVNVGGEGGVGQVVIKDDTGKEVARYDVGRLDAGDQNIDLSKLVGNVPAGQYTYSLDVKDSAGTAVSVTTYSRLRVDGVRYTASGPVLSSGSITIPLGNVIEISQ